MSQSRSSSFIEQPYDTTIEGLEGAPRETMLNLQYKVSSLETEKKMMQQEKNELIDKYEELLTKKNEQIDNIQEDFDFLYKQREELESKLKNYKETNGHQEKHLANKVEELQNTNNSLQREVKQIKREYEKTQEDRRKLETDFQLVNSSRNEMKQRLALMEDEVAGLHSRNKELVNKLTKTSEQLALSAQDRHREDLQGKVLNLQMTNNQLQLKIDRLLQQKTSVELLKQKNITLQHSLSQMEELREKYCKLEIENAELREKFNVFFSTVEESFDQKESLDNDTEILRFIDKFKHIQNENLVLSDKYNSIKAELNGTRIGLNNLQQEYDQLTDSYRTLEKDASLQKDLITKLERQKILNQREIEYLRDMLKRADEINIKNSKDTHDNKPVEQYLSNLEKLVDEYRNEINTLQKQVASHNPDVLTSVAKRPRLVSDGSLSSIVLKVGELERENVALSTKIRELEQTNKEMHRRLHSLQELNEKKKELHILQLKSNPASKYDSIKQEMLDLLKKENEDLIRRLLATDNEANTTLLPKSVFERQEYDKSQLSSKIEQLSKRNSRLKEIYSQKSKEILSVISKFFGYTIEFLPGAINQNDLSSRIKLVSRYMLNKEDDINAYLILDVESKSLKAHGSLEFKALCEDLVTNWINDKDQIPCFLSALNLSIYDKYGK